MYLERVGPDRRVEAREVLEGLAAGGSLRERIWGHIGLSTLHAFEGDEEQAIAECDKALALDPNFALAYNDIDLSESNLGHDEQVLAAAQAAVRILQGNADVEMSERSRAVTLLGSQSDVAFALNDFAASRALSARETLLPDYSGSVENARETVVVDLALEHDPAAALAALRALPVAMDDSQRSQRDETKIVLDYWLGNWSGVAAGRPALEALMFQAVRGVGASPVFAQQILSVQTWPLCRRRDGVRGRCEGRAGR